MNKAPRFRGALFGYFYQSQGNYMEFEVVAVTKDQFVVRDEESPSGGVDFKPFFKDPSGEQLKIHLEHSAPFYGTLLGVSVEGEVNLASPSTAIGLVMLSGKGRCRRRIFS